MTGDSDARVQTQIAAYVSQNGAVTAREVVRKTDASRATVYRTLGELEDAGALESEQEGSVTVWRLHLDRDARDALSLSRDF